MLYWPKVVKLSLYHTPYNTQDTKGFTCSPFTVGECSQSDDHSPQYWCLFDHILFTIVWAHDKPTKLIPILSTAWLYSDQTLFSLNTIYTPPNTYLFWKHISVMWLKVLFCYHSSLLWELSLLIMYYQRYHICWCCYMCVFSSLSH
jgi:hypothetical protein